MSEKENHAKEAQTQLDALREEMRKVGAAFGNADERICEFGEAISELEGKDDCYYSGEVEDAKETLQSVFSAYEQVAKDTEQRLTRLLERLQGDNNRKEVLRVLMKKDEERQKAGGDV